MTKDEIRALLNDLVSMDEGDIENTTVGNESIWSLLKSENYERLKSEFKNAIFITR